MVFVYVVFSVCSSGLLGVLFWLVLWFDDCLVLDLLVVLFCCFGVLLVCLSLFLFGLIMILVVLL